MKQNKRGPASTLALSKNSTFRRKAFPDMPSGCGFDKTHFYSQRSVLEVINIHSSKKAGNVFLKLESGFCQACIVVWLFAQSCLYIAHTEIAVPGHVVF